MTTTESGAPSADRGGAVRRCCWLLPTVLLTGCLSDSDAPVRSASLSVPAELQILAPGGAMAVRVFMNAEAVPRHTGAVDDAGGAVRLEFAAPAGEQSFTVVFDYRDPEFTPADGAAWEIARWTSGPVRVSDGEDVLLEIAEYVYPDWDGDGLSNLEELIARTDPGDAGDPGGRSGGDPGAPPAQPIVAAAEGIWRGDTPGGGEVFAILHDGRLLMTTGRLIVEGTYKADAETLAGDANVYGAEGGLLTDSGAVPLTATAGDGVLELAIGDGGPVFSLDADGASDAGASLARLTRTWTASLERPEGMVVFPVDDNGVITGAVDSRGCLYGGVFEVLDPEVNVYGIALALSDQVRRGCGPLEGEGYEGYASLVQDAQGLRLIVANGAHGLSLALGSTSDPPTANDAATVRAVAADGRILERSGAQWRETWRAPDGLHAVHCPTATLCWAVGEEDDGRATILRWEGRGWSGEGFVNGSPDEDLYDVTCTAPDRCWAVGENDGRRANIVRWDGAAWSPDGFDNDVPGAALHAVDCAGPGECWAVGEVRRGRGLIARWDGVRWSEVRAPVGRDLNDVACRAGGECLAVGDARRGAAVAARWDGRDWTALRDGLPGADLEAIDCGVDGVCWAIGRVDGDRAALTRHDGAGWSLSGFINGAPPDRDLRGLHCGAGTCWAVGDGGVALRLEAGRIWNRYDTGTDAPLRGVFVVAD